MSDYFEYDVYLSYNKADKLKVKRLANRLKGAGVRVWFDDWIIELGDDIFLAIERGLEATRVLLLCISQAALDSEWVMMERNTVLFRDPSNKDRRFIPLLLDDCNLPDTLRRYKYMDFREESDAAFKGLLAICQSKKESELMAHNLPSNRKLGSTTLKQGGEPLAVFERLINGHEDCVYCLALSPDGKWLVSGEGAPDNLVKVWNFETGECQAILEGHMDQVSSVAITSGGKRIISASFDESVRIWDTGSSHELAKLEGCTNRISSVIAFQGNARLLSWGSDRKFKLWDLESYNCFKTIECGREDIFSIAINRAGDQALLGYIDGRIQLWNIESGKCIATLRGHSDIVSSIQFTSDGCFAVSGSYDKTIKIWALDAGNCVGTLEGHKHKVRSVIIFPNNTLIASVDFQDFKIWIWDWKLNTRLQSVGEGSWSKIAEVPTSITISPDGSRLLIGTTYGKIYVYRLTGISPVSPFESTRRYVNAKVVLLGEGAVGKTSLAHRLIEDRYVIKDRSHGMSVWKLDLPLPPDATMEREALLWDLAGQENYRLIHQLFLDETALALLLINPQKDDPFSEAGDWLKALKIATNNDDLKYSTTQLLIFSQIDVGGMKLSKAKIDRFREQYCFVDWLATSAKTGENCSDEKNKGRPSKLKQLIAKSIQWDRLPWTSTPLLLDELKNAVMAMRDETDIRLLRFSELMQRLKQTMLRDKFLESDLRTAITLLHNHGLVRPLKFGDLVLLRPDLINGYAGAVIRAARSHTDEIGCVLEEDIYQLNFDFTGVERLTHRPDEELLLKALIQTFLDYSLCIAENTPQGRLLVFPSQYRREKEISHEPTIFVSYTFGGEWQTIWTTLVVRLWYSQEFESKELWRNAAEFASPKGSALGLMITNKQGEGEATISLYFDVEVPDDLKVIFIEYVHSHLAKYACDVVRNRRYICSCGKSVTDLDEVRKRIEAKKDFIYCQRCDEKVILIDFIEQRLKSDPVAVKILAMDQIAARELDAHALEQILTGHMMAIAGEANQIFRLVRIFDCGIDGEVEFKDNTGKASGKKIYVQFRSGNSYFRTRKVDGREVLDLKNEHDLKYWISQPVDVYLVVRQQDEMSGEMIIRWMNVTNYLNTRKKKKNLQIAFIGEKLNMKAVWKVRDKLFCAKQYLNNRLIK